VTFQEALEILLKGGCAAREAWGPNSWVRFHSGGDLTYFTNAPYALTTEDATGTDWVEVFV